MYYILSKYQIGSDVSAPSEQDRTVSVAQKTEIIGKSIVIDTLPVTSDKSRNQQQERALWLMEVCNQHIHDPETEAGNDDDTCSKLNLIKSV